jgi:peroxiredoxin
VIPNVDTAAAPKRRTNRARIVLCVSVVILAFAIPVESTPASGPSAPDFALRSLERGNQRLSEHRGDVVVLGFWASWCGDCRKRLPELNALYTDHRDAGLVMFGINLDRDPQRAREFARALDIDFPVLIDADGEVSRLYEVTRVPRIVVIDRDGAIRHVFDDAGDDGLPQWREQILALLAE